MVKMNLFTKRNTHVENKPMVTRGRRRVGTNEETGSDIHTQPARTSLAQEAIQNSVSIRMGMKPKTERMRARLTRSAAQSKLAQHGEGLRPVKATWRARKSRRTRPAALMTTQMGIHLRHRHTGKKMLLTI